jgi:hypothetical protein
MLSITPDQLCSAGGYISANWGDHGYRIEAVESPTHAVSLFHVACSDGSRFTVAADRWGNCQDIQPSYDSARIIADMHAAACAG